LETVAAIGDRGRGISDTSYSYPVYPP